MPEHKTPPRGAPVVRGAPSYPPRPAAPPQDTLDHWPPPTPGQLVTPHFALSEFSCPAAYGLPATPYPLEWLPRLTVLCGVLEAIRAACGGRVVDVLTGGGYREPAWNVRHHAEHPGAVLRSQHCEGRAADFRVQGLPAAAAHEVVLDLWRAGKLPDLGGLGRYLRADEHKAFLHVDTREHGLVTWDG